ncbi:FecR domain-containing protein [Paenibacillus sp. N3.4]|uniref:FecR domain-containing protein n=1 Tax=Paenibacillus sp. N3.4 TaxID=2603222 RepID=UPI0011CA2653|nr:FecR domain-containing protein [Paenibacillus sp. N3.4]TXK86031.1 hypothetical protein FU659_00865 [Paenibacillus sp. N3.4]
MRVTKKSFISLFLSFCLAFSLISILLVKPVEAKTVRVAVIGSLSGDVTVKKGGGSKTYDGYESMSLNQGDTIYTGASSSVTLHLSSGDADVTLGDNAEINVSDLNTTDGNKKSKLKLWAGSMWVKVKSLAGSNDEFEVETPTAVMGVRGTQFFVGIDPETGKIKMAVGAGNVSTTTVTNTEGSTQQSSITYLYPTQQITLDARDELKDLSLKIEFLDLEDFIRQASPEVIKELIRNKAEIDKENEEFIAKKAKEMANGVTTDGQTSLVLKDQAELANVKQNLENLIGNIAKTAVADKKIDKDLMDKIIAEANQKITDPTRKLDLDKVLPLDKTAGTDAEKEKQKQAELKKLEEAKKLKEAEQLKKKEEAKLKLAAALKALEEEKAKIDAANKQAENDAKAKAQDALDKQNQVVNPTPTPSNNDGNESTTPSPSLSLSTAKTGTNAFNLAINLSNFIGNNDIYGVEVHLLYSSNVSYNTPAGKIGTSEIFQDSNSADNMKEFIGETKELIYSVTNFGAGSSNIAVNGTKNLVTLPFTGYGTATVKVDKIMIVRKNGTAVQEIIVPAAVLPGSVSLSPGFVN